MNSYWQMRQALRSLGVRAPASVTPIEFVADYLHPIESRPRLRTVVSDIAEQYIAATFTSQPPSRVEVQAMRRAWQRTWWERVRARLRVQVECDFKPFITGG